MRKGSDTSCRLPTAESPASGRFAPFRGRDLMALEGRKSARGEVSGAFLLGLKQSFLNLHVLPADERNPGTESIDPEGWYPYTRLTTTLNLIAERVLAASATLFRAGMHFVRLWYEHGPGKTMIHSGRDWLHANRRSGGSNSVARAGPREEIEWCDSLSIDKDAGLHAEV
jgi:hypothetical protein